MLFRSSDGLTTPTSLTFGPDGKLYVVDTYQSIVFRFDAAGNASIYADYRSGLLFPTGLAFDAAGDLFVSQYLSGQILEINPFNQGTVLASGLQGVWGLDVPIPSTYAFDRTGGGDGDLVFGPGELPVVDGIAAVPEASSFGLAGLAGLALAGAATRRRRRR